MKLRLLLSSDVNLSVDGAALPHSHLRGLHMVVQVHLRFFLAVSHGGLIILAVTRALINAFRSVNQDLTYSAYIDYMTAFRRAYHDLP